MSIVVNGSELASRASLHGGKEAGQNEISAEERSMVLALSHVTPQQAEALRALAAGKPLNDAAAAAGVDRGTLYRWRTQDHEFIAALNAWRWEMQTHTRDRMLALADKAIAAVQASVEQGDARLGLRLLKDLNCSRVGRTRPHDPLELFQKEAGPEACSPTLARLRKVGERMTAEQVENIPELLALGVDTDNARRKAAAELAKAQKEQQSKAEGAL
jgi:hypothetical protein